ncbi:MAG: adenosylmethionine decarboxylase [Deltaproteobacteria bacterium]|nr:MAG: adenosylmethionine decarboxylase [Deltaproteobacteria bacterium]
MIAPPTPFEGPEKKFELTVVEGFPSLRSFGDETWKAVVVAAGAEILSKKSNEHFDAYLLSESSLFVFDTFLTIITCGQTSLVDGVREILSFIPPDRIAAAFYERKHENFPHHQSTTFFDDARRIAEWLPGRAVLLGAPHEHAVYLFHAERDYTPDDDDTTLEVLMHGIPADIAGKFRGVEAPLEGTVAKELGLADVLPGFELDEHVFSPTGYSLNALDGETYATIHVTPEDLGSYVSFETNLDFRGSPSVLIQRLIQTFHPESFDVVAFVPDEQPMSVSVDGYLLRKHIHEPASGYWVTFQHFYRPAVRPSRGSVLDLG